MSNQEVEEVYGKKNYFPNRTGNRNLREDLINKRLNLYKSNNSDMVYKGFQIVYGGDHGHKLLDGLMEYSGYTKEGNSIPTEGVKWTAGWSGSKIHKFNLIKAPWYDDRISKAITDFYKDAETRDKFLNTGKLENAIQDALNKEYAGHKYEDFMYNNLNSNLRDQIVYDWDGKPESGKWVDYVHILQPPTYYSEGFGTVYIANKNGNITYLDIPISAFGAVGQQDISAVFETLPTMSGVGEEVVVGVRVKSTFPDPESAIYSWMLTKKSDGKRLTQSEHKLKFSGNAESEAGKLSLENGQEYLLYATFTMPESDVDIQFKINENGTSPVEKFLGNNILQSAPTAVRWAQPKPLAYNVLSKKVALPIRGGDALTAQLNLPKGHWVDNARGSLDVVNQSTDLLRSFIVKNNPLVNEANETIARQPTANFTIDRKDFGDDPINKKWLNLQNPAVPLTKTGQISYSGSVQRNYEDTYMVCTKDQEGKEDCNTHTDKGTATAKFPSGTDKSVYEMYVYNGRSTMPKLSHKNEIEHNEGTSYEKKLWWESESYLYDVIRWMYHLNENDEVYGLTPVGGQYQRAFMQQASASVKWQAESTLKKQYEPARTAAAKKSDRKSDYDKAVFATDKELQKFAYPIKSGYYFNPAGSYTFTVETVSFKPTSEDTQDHKDLVSTFVDSFRYESDLIYINQHKDAVNIRDEQLTKRGAGYDRKLGVFTAKNSQGVDGQVMLQVLDRSVDASRYSKKVEEIEYSQESNGFTHDFWKSVLEGYTESKTADSSAKYSYREYVKSGQKMYKITEKTTVTIVVNPKNIPVYTHAQMQNGEYNVRVWIDKSQLTRGNHEYKKLGALMGIDNLDSMKITVIGSMYDDLDN
ncbi:hypothetical protein [Paenibacillus terrigena]|uniref:hypothetical protein n=1 Tax=Paenibacillus terrigena TaxID=369333 RepID=UPI0028D508FA|nr:hypothetical protein [Paenibacillus terrigena]